MKYIRKAGILLFWLAVWFAAGRIVENSLVLVGPEEVFMALGRLLPSSAFWKTVWCSLGHIVSGFLAGFLAGMLLGGAAYRLSLIHISAVCGDSHRAGLKDPRFLGSYALLLRRGLRLRSAYAPGRS